MRDGVVDWDVCQPDADPCQHGQLNIIPAGTITPTLTLTPSPTPDYPLAGYGPSHFPALIDPLTGLKVSDTALLERRPMIIKVSNLPRSVCPHGGLSLADHVYEYYTEEGTTRFAAVFYGQNATNGSARSAPRASLTIS